MFNVKLLTNDVVHKIDCPGCFDHVEVSLRGREDGRSCVMIKKYMDLFAERVKKMKVLKDDVWVVTFPKAGTTLTQELIWLISNDLDYETAFKINLNNRFPFLELSGVLNKFDGDSVGVCEKIPSPRHIKSHLRMFMLPEQLFTVNPKIIYVARNPRDLATSFYHHYTHIVGYEGAKEDFVEAFLSDQVIYAPYNEHVLDFWKIRNQPNVLFLFFEDMKRNMRGVVRKAMKFFDKNFSDEQIEKLCNHLSIESMRVNPSCNNDGLVEKAKSLNGKANDNFRFIRKGEVNTFLDEKFSSEIIGKFDALMSRKSLSDNDFAYK